MATGILIALTILLIAAAAYVGLLLLRRSRPVTQAGKSQTVGDLVRRRSAPDDVQGGDDVAATDLFTPKDPQLAAVVPPPDDVPSPTATDVALPRPTSRPAATPPGGVEVGDAPWRRAARMMGSEPGAAWETAPIPVVAVAEPAPEITPAVERTAVLEVPAAESPAADVPAAEPSAEPAPALAEAADVVADPADVVAVDPTDVVTADPAPSDTAVDDAPSPAPSRPLSDPDLTPLMGIPLVRPLGEAPAPPPAAAVDPEPTTQTPTQPATQPVTPRLSRPSTIDDDVVSFLPVAPAPSAAVTGSPQPVWFRVVRRDGEPVGGVLVTLLDGRGQEADATKTATDGGGELHAPHGGWFLMIASAEGFQPRAVTLAVDEQPVEIALLLPRSVTVAGVVRVDGAPAAGTRVVAFQEGEVVDEFVTDRDGSYRFDDLAEGVYALSASDARGSAVGRVTLSEGTDGQLDLDLRRADGAR